MRKIRAHSFRLAPMLEHAPASRSSVMDLLALRSVIELPIAQRHVLDPEILRTVAAVDRVGDLTRFNVTEVPELAHVSSPEELLTPDERGWALGNALSLAVKHGQRLWLSEVTQPQLEQLRAVLGEQLVHIASLDEAAGAEGARGDDLADESAPAGERAVVAVSPRRLLDGWATGTPEQIGYLRTVLEGTDPLRVSRHTLAALHEAEVDLALPAVYAPGFRGNLWVLWTIDIVTAVPYAWGIIAMVAGRRRRIRFAGFLVTLITFVLPYVYFFFAGSHGDGNHYPGWVIMVVIGLVLATVLLEGGHWLRDVAVARGLRARAG